MKTKIRTIAALGVTAFLGLAVPATANGSNNFVSFVAGQAEKENGSFNIIGKVVLALANGGYLNNADVAALSTAQITAFLPTDRAFKQLTAKIQGKPTWQVKESEVIPFLVATLGLDTIAFVVKYHVYAGGKVDYRTALSLDTNWRDGTNVYIPMYNGGLLGIDQRWIFLQLDDAGTAGFGSNNPFVVYANIHAGNAIVHGINEVLLP